MQQDYQRNERMAKSGGMTTDKYWHIIIDIHNELCYGDCRLGRLWNDLYTVPLAYLR